MQDLNNNWITWIIVIALVIWVASSFFDDAEPSKYKDSQYSASSVNDDDEIMDYEEDGYTWAENNDPTTFGECEDQFGAGYEEDACNEYVQENYSSENTFNGYECTEDCSGHEAGYQWAEDNGIYDEYDCNGNSNSFVEGCISYVEENY